MSEIDAAIIKTTRIMRQKGETTGQLAVYNARTTHARNRKGAEGEKKQEKVRNDKGMRGTKDAQILLASRRKQRRRGGSAAHNYKTRSAAALLLGLSTAGAALLGASSHFFFAARRVTFAARPYFTQPRRREK